MPGLRVQRDKLIARCRDDDPFLPPVRPVGNAAAVSSRAPFEPPAFIDSPCPQRLARRRIGRNHRSPITRCEVQNAVDHERCGFSFVFRSAAKIIGPPDPGDLEILHIVAVDLI